jgi:DMSO/TMAO reductase YedYZ molybdopterin-dependent catalytic subunit
MGYEDRKGRRDVAKGKAYLTAALALGAATAIGAPASAQPAGSAPAPDTRAQDRATNEKMLAALLERRAAIVARPGPAEGKRSALQFLDRQIARVRAELGG